LVRQWTPLREAIEASRSSLRTRSDLERLAADWDQGGRDESYLLRGNRLAGFDEWIVKHGDAVTALEHEFIEAAKALAAREGGVLWRLFRPGNAELQAELRNREVQLLEQASQLGKQQAQLREQAIRLRQLAEFDRQSSITGGVFISYSHDDKDVVDVLANRLAADQINYWLDEKDLFVGDVVDKAISKGIQQSLLFIIVLTPTSISSRWVERELDEAAHEESEGQKIVLPIIAKGLPPKQIPARLRRKLYVDISKSFDDGYAKLTRSIRHHLRTQVVKSSLAP
jgi:hypothetical protein